MSTTNLDLSVILKLIDRFSGPLIASMHKFNTWSDSIHKADTVSQKFGRNLTQIGNSMSAAGRKLSISLTAPILLLGGIAVKKAIEFESAFTGVRKTVEANEKEFIKIEKDFKQLARIIPLSTTEIYGIGEAAGQLGIKNKNLVSFAKVMADLGATTNMSANDAATSLARFANITGMSQDKFDRLGSTIVDLGNNLATTEAEIVNMSLRLAANAKRVGMSEAQIMGLAGALSSVGVRAEMGGTSFSQVIFKISKEIGSGSEALRTFAAVSNKSVKSFEKDWKKDATQSLIDFVKGIGRVQKAGVNIAEVFDSMGMDGIRIADTLSRLVGSGDKFKDALDRGSRAWEKNTALIKEANLRYGTMESRIRILKNKLDQLAESFGKEYALSFVKFGESFTPIIEGLEAMEPESKKAVGAIALLVAAIGPLIALFAAFVGFAGIILTFSGISLVIGGITAAFAGLSAALFQVIKYWKTLKSEFSKDAIGSTLDMLHFATGKITPTSSDMKRLSKPSGLISGYGEMFNNMFFGGNKLTEGLFTSSESENSKSEIVVKVKSDEGTSATIENVKGNENLKVINDSFLGFAFGGGS